MQTNSEAGYNTNLIQSLYKIQQKSHSKFIIITMVLTYFIYTHRTNHYSSVETVGTNHDAQDHVGAPS